MLFDVLNTIMYFSHDNEMRMTKKESVYVYG